MQRAILSIVAALTTFAVSCSDKLPGASLEIGGVPVALGESYEQVTTRFSANYTFLHVEGSNHWIIHRNADPTSAVGGVTFDSDRLSFATAHRGRFARDEALEFFSRLVSEIDTLKSCDRAVTVEQSTRSLDRGQEFSALLFRCGSHTVVAGMARGDAVSDSLSIEVSIGWPLPSN